ncbi:MAG TPA: lipocalin-like domain-containing protein [Gemmatimonadales bacterium]
MSLPFLLFSAAVLFPAAPRGGAQTVPPAPPIVGTWLLESIVDTLTDGSVSWWMGRHPTGAIVYSASGHMSVQFMRDPRPETAAPAEADAARLAGAQPFAHLPADQLRDQLEGYYAYFGRYQLNAAGDSISHYVETSLRPTEVGVTYRRKVQLDGDRLFISLHAVEGGVPRHRVLTWRRAVVTPMHREPRHHMVLEAPGIRVMDVRIRPQDTTLYHHHEHTTLYVAIDVSPTDAQRLGGTWAGTKPADDPGWQPGGIRIDSSYAATPLTHRVTNVGASPFRLLAISVRSNTPVSHAGELPGRMEATSSWFRQSRVVLAPSEASGWFASASSVLVVQPLAGRTEVATEGAARLLDAPGSWTLIAPGQRYRLRNTGTGPGDAVVIQVP